MTFIVDGTNGATFPDTTVQTTALTTGAVTAAMISTSTSTGFGLCRAWVNFAGANGAINASYNVSSVTYSITGAYIVNFTTAFTDAKYVVCGCLTTAGQGGESVSINGTLTTTTAPLNSSYKTASYNPTVLTVAFFR
jgi:hypothetical protein